VRYFARKVGFYLLALWGAVTLNFFLPRFIPGNPVEVLLARMTESGNPPPGEYKVLSSVLGIGGGNLFDQYWHYLRQLSKLNLGVSITEFPTPVTHILAQTLPWTIILVGTATVMAFFIGTTLGALAGWKRSRFLNNLLPVTTFLTATPYFWLALVILYLFGVVLHYLPLSGGYDPTLNIGWSWSFLGSAVQHAVLPGATIVLAQLGGWMLSMRNMTLTTLSEDYVSAAEAKGIRPNRVLLGYAARNAVLPSVTGFAISLGFVVSGSIIMEIVFSYPGIGYTLLQAVQNDDYALMQGIFLVICLVVLGANFLVDMLYGFIDPRTKQAR
jgi:peptide/nickel transport system permease protein